MSEPTLPYEEVDGTATAGHSGSEASRERAESEARDGTASLRQKVALDLLNEAATRGLTWRDLSEATGWHHGQSSGALSVLHKTARVSRLRAKRDKCQVYVLPSYVYDRPTSPYKPRPTVRANPDDVLSTRERALLEMAKQRMATSVAYVCLDRSDFANLLNLIESRTQ